MKLKGYLAVSKMTHIGQIILTRSDILPNILPIRTKRMQRCIPKTELVNLKKGTFIEIDWIDSCLTRNVAQISNKTFATYRKSVGRFIGIYEDETYQEPHLLLSSGSLGFSFDILSIPMGSVMNVKVIGEQN
jgi:hypothetical protein